MTTATGIRVRPGPIGLGRVITAGGSAEFMDFICQPNTSLLTIWILAPRNGTLVVQRVEGGTVTSTILSQAVTGASIEQAIQIPGDPGGQSQLRTTFTDTSGLGQTVSCRIGDVQIGGGGGGSSGGGGGGVATVSGTAPITSTGGANPNIGIQTSAPPFATVTTDATPPIAGFGPQVLYYDTQISQITSAPASGSVISDAGTPAQGSSISGLRADATFTALTGVPIAVGTQAAAGQGFSTSLARSDHAHYLSPAGLQDTLTNFAGNPDLANQRIVNLADPVGAQDAATRNYVDSKPQVSRLTARAVTTGALPTNTLSGNVLTASANGALPSQDGIALAVGNRLLVTSEATGSKNGLYSVTSLGSGGSPWVLTRTTDANTSALVVPMLAVAISEGTVNAGAQYYLSTPAPITLNTTSLTFLRQSFVRDRTAASGTTSISASTTVTLATITRLSTETFDFSAFCTNNVTGVTISPGVANPGTDSVSIWLEATSNVGEVALRARNNNASATRTIDWKLIGQL